MGCDAVTGADCTLFPTAKRKPLMPMQPPKPTVPTSLPMYFMVSNSAKHGTTCMHHGSCIMHALMLLIHVYMHMHHVYRAIPACVNRGPDTCQHVWLPEDTCCGLRADILADISLIPHP